MTTAANTNPTEGAILLKVRDAAPLLGCAGKPNEVYRMAAQFPPGVMVRIGRRVRISRPKLEAWLREQGALPGAPALTLVPKTEERPTGAGPRHIRCPECGCDVTWTPNEAKEGRR